MGVRQAAGILTLAPHTRQEWQTLANITHHISHPKFLCRCCKVGKSWGIPGSLKVESIKVAGHQGVQHLYQGEYQVTLMVTSPMVTKKAACVVLHKLPRHLFSARAIISSLEPPNFKHHPSIHAMRLRYTPFLKPLVPSNPSTIGSCDSS